MNPIVTPGGLDLAALLTIAVRAAEAPAGLLREYFVDRSFDVMQKDDGSPVTIADRRAESLIRERLSQDAGRDIDMLGEEDGLSGSGNRWRWVIDPIDGTRSFVAGIPLFGTIVALYDAVEQSPIVGVIHLPMLEETYAAARGTGSLCRGRTVRVSQQERLAQAIVSAGDPLQFTHAQCEPLYARYTRLAPCVRGYTDCFGHGLVVRGAVDLMLDPDLNPWDVLATQVLVEEAGGTMRVRPSATPGKVDALFGSPALVESVSASLPF